MDVVKSIRGMTTDGRSVFVKMMDSQKIAGTSVSTTNYPMTNHVGHRDDRRTHGALCTGTYLCHVHTVAYDPWITWISVSRRKNLGRNGYSVPANRPRPTPSSPNGTETKLQVKTNFLSFPPIMLRYFFLITQASLRLVSVGFYICQNLFDESYVIEFTNFLKKKEQGRVWDDDDGSSASNFITLKSGNFFSFFY